MECASYSPLCSACKWYLYSSANAATSNGSPDRPHHSSLQSLRQAADSACYICSVVFDNVVITEKNQSPCSRARSRGTMVDEDPGTTPFALHFQLYPENDQYWVPMIKLEVSVSFRGLYSLTKFRLVSESGEQLSISRRFSTYYDYLPMKSLKLKFLIFRRHNSPSTPTNYPRMSHVVIVNIAVI